MTPAEFQFIAGLLKKRSGLQLTEDKIYLLENRLTPIARQSGLDGLGQLVQKIQKTMDAKLIQAVTEAMTTNESYFFRDSKPFELFKDHVLPSVKTRNAGTRKIRIWCAAASSGQEAYSLAMILKEQEHQLQGWNVDILATDISKQVLDKARAGIYSQFEVQRGLPIRQLMTYFTQNGETWQINPDLKRVVRFEEFNLLDSYNRLGQFDVVFCRNVLIYFDQATKADILNRIHGVVPEHGILFLGASETVLGITDRFKPVAGQRGMYVTAESRSSAENTRQAAVG